MYKINNTPPKDILRHTNLSIKEYKSDERLTFRRFYKMLNILLLQKKYSLKNISQIKIVDGSVEIKYNDGALFKLKENCVFDINYKNNKNYPEVDHCN